MVDITTNEPRVTKVRYTVSEQFDIEVTINKEINDLSIIILSEEDKRGQDTELIYVSVDENIFIVDREEDIGEKLHSHLEKWFVEKYGDILREEIKDVVKKDFDDIFNEVWKYIEEKDLY